MLTGSFAAAHLVFPALWAVVAGFLAGWCSVAAGVRYSHILMNRYGLANPAENNRPSNARSDEMPPALLSFLLAAACGATACLLYWRFGATLPFLAYFLAVMILLVLGIVDSRTGLLPDALTLPLLWAGLLLAWMRSAVPMGGVTLHDAVAGAALGYGCLYALFVGFRWLRKRDGMGYGDFKLAAAIGAWAGWQLLPHILLLACVAGIAVHIISRHPSRWNAVYPFGPFLAASGILAFIAAPALHSYLG